MPAHLGSTAFVRWSPERSAVLAGTLGNCIATTGCKRASGPEASITLFAVQTSIHTFPRTAVLHAPLVEMNAQRLMTMRLWCG